MSRNMRLFLAIMMILVGAIKAWIHTKTMATLVVPGCLGRNFTLQLDVPLWQQVHCWGCYLAIGGLIVLAVELFRAWAPRDMIAAT